MSGNNNTAWSSKFKKFGINDPFLKLITVKYEKSIPWQTVVKDEATLNIYLRDILIPELKKKTKPIDSFSWKKAPKSLFICPNDLLKLDLEKILKSPYFENYEVTDVSIYLDEIYDYEDLVESEWVKDDFETFKDSCIVRAVIELSPILNRIKEESFMVWFEVIERNYEQNYGFQYLILKPIIEKSGYNSIKLLPHPDNDLLKWIFIRIQYEFYNASTNFRNEYNIRFENFEVSDWPYITPETANPSKFIAEASKNDWCFEIKIKDHVPYSPDESLELTILRALERIIINDCSDFTDIIFLDEILEHPQFKKIRKEAWLKAVLKNPTFYFAIPSDLIEENIWSPQKNIDNENFSSLINWISEIEKRPWILEYQNTIPNSVKYHEDLLRAYLRGWGKILSKTPFKIWKEVNTGKQIFISYAALRNFYIFSILANSFGPKGGGYLKASKSMKRIPAYQLAYYYSTIINKTAKHSIIYYYPKKLREIPLDPQNELIKLYLTNQFNEFTYLINKKNIQENYYFNKMDPNKPLEKN